MGYFTVKIKTFLRELEMKVVQCWDDGVVTDLRVIELLYKYNAKATFNLCPGLMNDERIPSHWAEAGYKGWSHRGFFGGHIGKKELYSVYKDFQVASHCWCHEVAGRVPDDVFIKGAVDARKYLEDVFGRECRGFAWPCSGNTPETCDLLRENGFAYARVVGNTDDVTSFSDPMLLTPNCHFQAPDFYERYEKAKATGVFYFWGHSYEMLDSEGLLGQLEHKIAWISNDPDAEWADVIDII